MRFGVELQKPESEEERRKDRQLRAKDEQLRAPDNESRDSSQLVAPVSSVPTVDQAKITLYTGAFPDNR